MDGLTGEDLLRDAQVSFGNIRGRLWRAIGPHMGRLQIIGGGDNRT